MSLFGRSVVVNAGGLQVKGGRDADGRPVGLRVAFKIEKTLKPEPNTIDLSIFNLNAETRARLEQVKVPVSIEAGYEDETELLFLGDVTLVSSTKQGPDWVTSLKSGDGSKSYRTATVSASLKKGAKKEDAFAAVAGAMGFPLGNLVDKLRAHEWKGAIDEFNKGIVMVGQAQEVFQRMAADEGLEWSVQNGAIQVLEQGEALPGEVPLIAEHTGMIGSPVLGEATETGGSKHKVLKFRSLLRPRLSPGRKVKVQSSLVEGFYRIEKTTFTGDTHGGDWYADIEGRAL